MSGIFGFSITDDRRKKECIGPLKKWNHCYGEKRQRLFLGEKKGIGCCQNHLSEKIPCSAPVLIYDGRKAVIDAVLYNREEISALLNIADSASMSDEELLLQLLTEKGFSALAGVNGDFSGAFYDEKKDTWTLFRDHMGIRPLFYYIDGTTFAFSTDIRGLSGFPGADMKLNEEQLYLHMMGYSTQSAADTEFANIRCVPPASYLTVRADQNRFTVNIQPYWQLGTHKVRLKNDAAYQQELRCLITDSVKRRLDAVTGLIGAELSGGWDSSIIAILICQLGRKGVYHSWSYRPEDLPLQEEDERKIILDLCEQENISCHFKRFEREVPGAEMNQILNDIAPPYLNTLEISRGAAWMKKQGARVVFTGHGGDEGVSHRSNLYELWYHKEYFSFVRAIYRQTKGKKFRILRTGKKVYTQIFKVHPQMRKNWQKESQDSVFLTESFKERLRANVTLSSLKFAYDPASYIRNGGSRSRMDNGAIQGAQTGVQYMFPFLDYRVIDYAVSIPRYQFQNGWGERWVYRQAFNDMVPQSLREVDYKDLASMRNYDYGDRDFYKMFLENKEWILQNLDRSFWKEYLDFDALEQFEPEDRDSERSCKEAIYQLTMLLDLVVTENMVKKTRTGCEYDDKTI